MWAVGLCGVWACVGYGLVRAVGEFGRAGASPWGRGLLQCVIALEWTVG